MELAPSFLQNTSTTSSAAFKGGGAACQDVFSVGKMFHINIKIPKKVKTEEPKVLRQIAPECTDLNHTLNFTEGRNPRPPEREEENGGKWGFY